MKHTIVIPGVPQPQLRHKFSRRGTHVHVYDPTKQYREWLSWQMKLLWPHELITNAFELYATFFMPIPKSLRRKVKENQPHIKKPDASNLTKCIEDSGNGIIWQDDSRCWHSEVKKVYSEDPRIELTVDY